jgi:phage baseplate assembly protein gpV
VIDDLLGALTDSIEDVNKKFYGVVVGKVINPVDPMMLGRVQVQLPFIDSVDLSPWARVATMMAGPTHGTYFIPDIGDEVLVAFEHGDINVPYVIGSLWNATAPPPLPSPLPQIRTIRTLAGNQIMFMEIPPTIIISTPSGQTVLLAPTGVQILSHASLINISPDGVTVSGNPNLNLVATAAINIQAPTVTVNGAAATNVQSGGACNVTAPIVKIN